MLDLPPGGFRTLLWERGLGPSLGSWLSMVGAGSWARAASLGPPGSPGSCLAEALAAAAGQSQHSVLLQAACHPTGKGTPSKEMQKKQSRFCLPQGWAEAGPVLKHTWRNP